MVERYCVIGRDVSHSPSPSMMNAAFKSLGVDATYSRVSVSEKRFSREFDRLVISRFKGMNVTIPFKTAVIPFLSGMDGVATRIQAVNTVKSEGRGYVGHNTDPDGIVGPLRRVAEELDVRNALVIGAGGAARAFCEAMNRMGWIDVAVAVRDLSRSRGFVSEMEKAFPKMNITPAQLDDLRHLNHDLVFNASPMGSEGEPLPKEVRRIIPGTKVVFDAVYRPRETRLLAEAKKNKSVAIPGEEMLLHQGMAAFTLWTEKTAPAGVMGKALRASLGADGRRRKR